jgi:hypothetical protein
MATLTPNQIAELCFVAGQGRGNLDVAVAVALAESGGKTDARNTNSDTARSVDRGLWQINSYWHPEVGEACADNPVCATKEARRISRGFADFSQWSAYKNGSYTRHLPTAAVAASHARRKRPASFDDVKLTAGEKDGKEWYEPGFLFDRIPNPLEPVKDVAGAIAEFTRALFDPNTWQRVGIVVGGAILLLLGVLILGRDLIPAGAVAKVAARGKA